MGLSFVTLGVGDAFSAKHYSSCLAVESDGAWLLVDCPHPIRKILHESGQAAGVPLDVGNFSAVAITHLHADHCSGLEGFLYFASFVLQQRPLVLTHPHVAARLWSGHLAAGMEQLMPSADARPERKQIGDYTDLSLLSTERAVTVGPFSIECHLTVHHIPTTALRIRAGGRCLGISADTAYDVGLLAWLGEADLVVHETNYGVHTPYEKLAALPETKRAKMRLIHYPDDFDTNASVIEPLVQGRRYEV
jgi:ribonuclease BN (tRNA processing enzyme)